MERDCESIKHDSGNKTGFKVETLIWNKYRKAVFLINKLIFVLNGNKWHDKVSLLILVPIRSGLRGFCLSILDILIGISAKETAQTLYHAIKEVKMVT